MYDGVDDPRDIKQRVDAPGDKRNARSVVRSINLQYLRDGGQRSNNTGDVYHNIERSKPHAVSGEGFAPAASMKVVS